MDELNYPFVKATPQHRLGAVVLDSVFCALTFYIGYIVWALIVWGQGQTPAKQILKMRVYSIDTGKPAHGAIWQLDNSLSQWRIAHCISHSLLQLWQSPLTHLILPRVA
jgi:uncharacterized RDD family membrane protein YckC